MEMENQGGCFSQKNPLQTNLLCLWSLALLHPWHHWGPHPHLALNGTDPSPPGQPQEQTPVDKSHAEVEIKPQLNPKGRMVNEEDQNLSTSCTSCTLNSHEQLHRCCLYGIHKRTNESSHRGKHIALAVLRTKHIALAVLRTHRNRVRLECDSPNSRSRDPSSPALESFLERWSCALAHGGD